MNGKLRIRAPYGRIRRPGDSRAVLGGRFRRAWSTVAGVWLRSSRWCPSYDASAAAAAGRRNGAAAHSPPRALAGAGAQPAPAGVASPAPVLAPVSTSPLPGSVARVRRSHRWADELDAAAGGDAEATDAAGAAEPVPTTDPAPEVVLPLMRFQKEWLAWALTQEASGPWGGILADEMGMGKTIQAISLVLTARRLRPPDLHSVASSSKSSSGSGRVLVASLCNDNNHPQEEDLESGT